MDRWQPALRGVLPGPDRPGARLRPRVEPPRGACRDVDADRRARISKAPGLVAAYAFDRGSGTVAADASGKGNTGAILGATWARGRFGGALRFHGAGEVVRVPGAESLDLRGAMTLSAWIRPSEPQSGWRTVVARQTDAYFLTAGGGSHADLGMLDDALAALLIGATLGFGLMLAAGRPAGSPGSDARGGRLSRCSWPDRSSMPCSRLRARSSARPSWRRGTP